MAYTASGMGNWTLSWPKTLHLPSQSGHTVGGYRSVTWSLGSHHLEARQIRGHVPRGFIYL